MKRTWFIGPVAIVFLVTAWGGCKPDVGSDPGAYVERVQAAFDPAVGIAPLPNDILRVGGKVQITTTVNPCGLGDVKLMPPALEEFTETYLNTLDGFLPELPLTFQFWSPDPENLLVDPAAFTQADIRVYKITEWAVALQEEMEKGLTGNELLEAVKARLSLPADATDPVQGQLPEVDNLVFASELTPVDYSEALADCFDKPLRSQFWQMTATPPAKWEPGETYAAFLLTSVMDTGDTPRPIISNLTFNFLKTKVPLVESSKDPEQNPDPLSLIPASDADALMLEQIRLAMKPLLDYVEDHSPGGQKISRSDMALAWTFTVTTAGSLAFDPSAGVVPSPNDLILAQLGDPAQAQGILPADTDCTAPESFFELPEEVRVQADFFCWLSTLDGFSATSAPAAAFTRPLDPASVTDDTALFYDITGVHPEAVEGAALSYNEAKRQVSFTPSGTLVPGHQYLVLLLDGLKGSETTGEGDDAVTATYDVVPSPAMAMLKLTHPLSKDGVTQVPGLVSDADAPVFEAIRLQYEPLLTVLEDLGMGREDIVGFFTFTVSSANEALFDPNLGVIPFPNEVLLDLTTGLVNLPISDSDPDALKNLAGGLNTLDGFSTIGSLTTGFSLPLDPASLALAADAEFADATETVTKLPELLASASVGIADITDAMSPDDPTQLDPARLGEISVLGPNQFDIDFDQGQIVVTPKGGKPLPPNRRYMVVVFDRLKSAQVETDVPPPPIIVSPMFFMARTPHALAGVVDCPAEVAAADPDKVCWKSFLPQLLTDADAEQLEGLRSAYKAIFDNFKLFKIEREQVLLFFTFNTATTYGELQAILDEWSKGPDMPELLGSDLLAAGDAEVTALFQEMDDSPVTGVSHVCVDCALKADMLLDEPDVSQPDSPVMGHFAFGADGKPDFRPNQELPFLFVLPEGAGPFPVVLFQHGLDGSRKEAVKFASELAQAGFAVVSLDAPLHGDHPVRIAGTENGTGFFSADVLAVRDNLRQAILDQYQMTRFISDGGLNAFVRDQLVLAGAAPDPLDSATVHYVGESLGGIIGGASAAVNPELDRVALVTPAGHLMKVFMETPNEGFKQPLVDALDGLGIQAGTPAFLQFVDFAQWALDRADPVNFGWIADAGGAALVEDRFLFIKALGDDFLPNTTTDELRNALSLADGTTPALKEFEGDEGADLCHGFFMGDCGPEAVKAKARQNVIEFLKGDPLTD
ncbi:MAG: hypothetical protein ISR64_06170 [Deltaproteobacteria bacterium]|nr:hypothetical protein [Deltaproteobacteria bacterium]